MKKSVILFVSLLIAVNLSFISAGSLKVSDEHPFFVDGKWVKASELKVGDELMNVDGKKVRIIGIKEVKLDLPIEVYNLDSEGFDNFVVDKEKVVVHNSEKIECIPDYKNIINSLEALKSELEKVIPSLKDDFVIIDPNSPDIKKFNEIIEKPADEITPDERAFADSLAKSILDQLGVHYTYISEKEGFLIHPDDSTFLGKIAARCNLRNFEVYLRPLNEFPGEYFPSGYRIIYSLDSLFDINTFDFVTKHEFNHLILRQKALKNLYPSVEDLASIAYIELTSNNYGLPRDDYAIDEMFSRWADSLTISKNIPKDGSLKNLEKILNSVKRRYKTINTYGKAISHSLAKMQEIISTFEKDFDVSVNREGRFILASPDKNSENYIFIQLVTELDSLVLEISIGSGKDSMRFYIRDESAISKFGEIIFNPKFSLDGQREAILDYLNNEGYGINAQINAIINSAKHSIIATDILIKEIESIIQNPISPAELRIRLCKLRDFIARTQLSRGIRTPEISRILGIEPLNLGDYSSEQTPSLDRVIGDSELSQ